MSPPVLALPRWAYRPGAAAPAPREADRAPLDAAKTLVPPRYGAPVPADDAALAYGLTLNDAGFFWECHEVLEAVWKAAPQGGRDRILLRACIQIANANLKTALNRPAAAARLIAEARSELAELARRTAGAAGTFATDYPATVLAASIRNDAATWPVRLIGL